MQLPTSVINVWAVAVLFRGACNCLPVLIMCGLLQSLLEVHAIAYQCHVKALRSCSGLAKTIQKRGCDFGFG